MSRRPDVMFLDLADTLLERPRHGRTTIDEIRVDRLAQRLQDAYEAYVEEEMDDAREAGR